MQTYYFSSMSIAATLFSILLLGWGFVTIWLVFRIKRMLDKLDKLTDSSADIASNVNELVRTTTQRIISIEKAFLTAQGLKEVANIVTTLFHTRKVKGAIHDTE